MIGAGASGKVYRSLSQADGKYYAIKFLRKAFATDPGAVERFLAEFDLVARLRHPNIMPVLGCGRADAGAYFFAMELANGDLQQRVGGRISSARAVDWLLQAAAGVQHAHDHGIIHCDLKPSNLLLSKDKRVLVSDFGLARRERDPGMARSPGRNSGVHGARASNSRLGHRLASNGHLWPGRDAIRPANRATSVCRPSSERNSGATNLGHAAGLATSAAPAASGRNVGLMPSLLGEAPRESLPRHGRAAGGVAFGLIQH